MTSRVSLSSDNLLRHIGSNRVKKNRRKGLVIKENVSHVSHIRSPSFHAASPPENSYLLVTGRNLKISFDTKSKHNITQSVRSHPLKNTQSRNPKKSKRDPAPEKKIRVVGDTRQKVRVFPSPLSTIIYQHPISIRNAHPSLFSRTQNEFESTSNSRTSSRSHDHEIPQSSPSASI